MPDFTRDDVPRDHPLHRSFSKIDRKRTKQSLDDIFDFGQNNLERDDVEVGASGSHGVTVEPSGHLEDDEFDTFTEKAKESKALGYNRMDKVNYLKNDDRLSSPDPFDVHADRSTYAAKQDSKRKAKVTTDPEKYANDPDSFDFPFVDTPKEFKDKYDSTDWNKFERMAGEDDVFEW